VVFKCLAALGACAAILAPPASAGWLAPQPLSAPDRDASSPAIALGPDGRLIAAWARFDGSNTRIEAAVRPPGGALEQAQIVSEAGQSAGSPQVALDAQGNALLMWIRNASVQWATRAAGASAFGDLHTLPLPAGELAGAFRMAVAPSGAAAVLLWTSQGSGPTTLRLRAFARPPGGDFASAGLFETVTNGGSDDYHFDTMDMDADAQGGFYATWSFRHNHSPTGPNDTAVKVARRPAGSASFTVEQVVSGVDSDFDGGVPNTSVGSAHTGVDAAGAVNVVFTVTNLESVPEQSTLLLNSRGPGVAFPNPVSEVLSPLQPNGAFQVDVDMNASGTGAIVWQRGFGANGVVEGCIRPAGGPCGQPQTLATGTVFEPFVAIGTGGEAVAAWRRTLGAADGRFRPAGGGFGPAHELGSGTQVLLSHEAMDVDALGHGVVALDRISASRRLTEAVVNDPVAPSITPFTAPPGGSQGDALAFSAGVSDVWGPVSSVWTFGDGSSAAGPTATHSYAAPGAFTASLTATDAGGNTASRSAQVAIADTVAPGILSFRLKNRVFAVGARPTPLSALSRPPRGTVFRFALTESASARIKIQRGLPGRRVRGRCRRPSPELSSRPRCTRWVTKGTLRRRASAGLNRVRFSGRLGRRALRVGRYRAVLVAVDAAGNRSRPARVGFRVVRG
jgi:hypothetical protein